MARPTALRRPARILRDVPPVGQNVRNTPAVRRDVPAANGVTRLLWDLDTSAWGVTTVRVTDRSGPKNVRLLELSFSAGDAPVFYWGRTEAWAHDPGAQAAQGVMDVTLSVTPPAPTQDPWASTVGLELHGDRFTFSSIRTEFLLGDLPETGKHPVGPDLSPAGLRIAVDALAGIKEPARWALYRGWIEEAMVRISAVTQALPAAGAEPGHAAVAPQNLMSIKSSLGRRQWSAAASAAVADVRVALDAAVRAYFRVDAKAGNEED